MLLYMHVRHGVLLRLRQLKGSRDDVQHAGPLSHKIAMWLSSDVLLCVSVETFGSCRAKVWPSDCVVGCRRQPRPGQYPANFSPFRMASAGSLSVTALSKRYARPCCIGQQRAFAICVHVIKMYTNFFIYPWATGARLESSRSDDSVLRGLFGRDAKSDIRRVREEYRNTFKSSYFDERELPQLDRYGPYGMLWHPPPQPLGRPCSFKLPSLSYRLVSMMTRLLMAVCHVMQQERRLTSFWQQRVCQ